jgi:hypothetical protein
MCLACEMDAWWFAEMEAAALRANADAGAKPVPDNGDHLTAADVASTEPKSDPKPAPASPFWCEETRSE